MPNGHILFGVIFRLLLAPVHSAFLSHPGICTYTYQQEHVRVNAHDILMEIYEPHGVRPRGLVFVLHGSAGALTRHSAEMPLVDNMGERRFASSCFITVFPHYLEGVGRKSILARSEMIAEFPKLVTVVNSLLDDAESLPHVDRKRVYIFGDSLGAYLGLALAFRRSEVAAVSEVSGGIPRGYSPRRGSTPRILILHGELDRVVPVSAALALDKYCRAHDMQSDMVIFPRASHYLTGPFRSKVVERTITFYRSGTENPGRLRDSRSAGESSK